MALSIKPYIENKERIHLIGIGGVSMNSLGELLLSRGAPISGSDRLRTDVTARLEALGAKITYEHKPENVEGASLIVRTAAVHDDNPEIVRAHELGIPVMERAEAWGHLMRDYDNVVCLAGTHGKTTTSSVLAWILEACGKAPGYLIGGVPSNFSHSARLSPESPYFVIEGDEYDTCFFDKRSKFVHYCPRTAILNNLEYDHADIFENVEAIEKSFHHLVRTMAQKALVVANGQSATLDRVLEMGCWSRVERFDSENGWTISEDGEVAFRGESFGILKSPLLGRHNQLNTLAAIAAARDAGVDPREAIAAMESFSGVKRRLEVKGTEDGVTVIDDFAHHPTAIRETIAALRGKIGYGKGRLIAVLEPRSNTMKMGTMRAALPGSLSDADQVFCYAGAGVRWNEAEALAPLGDKAHTYTDLDLLVKEAAAYAAPGDSILVMSNGGFGGVHGKLLAALREKAS